MHQKQKRKSTNDANKNIGHIIRAKAQNDVSNFFVNYTNCYTNDKKKLCVFREICGIIYHKLTLCE